jgi:hypothetical protein
LFEVIWQHVYKHINKSIIDATLRVYRSRFVTERGVKGNRSEISKILFQALWNVAQFELVNGDFL